MAISRKAAKRYSIAEARHDLAGVVREAEAGSVVEITRRGRAVAVVLASAEYDLLRAGRKRFSDAYAEWRRRQDPPMELDPDEIFAGVRDPSPGREPPW